MGSRCGLRSCRSRISRRDLHRAVRLSDGRPSRHSRHRRQRLVRARGLRGALLASVEPPGARAENLGHRARRRSVFHVREPVLVVQHVFLGGRQRHAAADVSGRRAQAARRLHPAGCPARRTAGQAGHVSAVRFLGPPDLDRVDTVDCGGVEDRRRQVRSDADADLSAASRLQPAAGRPRQPCGADRRPSGRRGVRGSHRVLRGRAEPRS